MHFVHLPYYLIAILIFLIFCSAFFSAAETAMMALNRYRMRHMARKGNRAAIRVLNLLKRPDRLLALVLVGSTFASILASSIATIIASHYLGPLEGGIVSTVLLTFIILIFCELGPKTIAALYPQHLAFPLSLPLKFLITFAYPLIWLVNLLANSMLHIFRLHIKTIESDSLSEEELQTVVRETSGKISSPYQSMLLRILDLGRITVEEVMIHRSEIYGIDITDDWDKILQQLKESEHINIPIYRENINKVIGVLDIRKIILSPQETLSKKKLIEMAQEVYFIPDVTSLSQQLLNFQRERQSLALVVDEYGDIQGLITLQDILEEISGEFASDHTDINNMVRKQADGSLMVEGMINLRDLNRLYQLTLPTDGPRTLNGLIIEYLEVIPASRVCLTIAGYPIEILKIHNNRIRLAQIWPR